MRALLLLLMITQAMACSTPTVLANQTLVNPGQSTDEVIKILGSPGDKQFNGKYEVWQYCAVTNGFDSYVKHFILWFYDGKLLSMSTYPGESGSTDCNTSFKTINWKNAPEPPK